MADIRSPLAHRADDLVRLEAVEVPSLAQIDVRCGPAEAEHLKCPMEPNTVIGDVHRGVLWLGPDEWLVVSLPGTADATAEAIGSNLEGSHHAVVDVSANRAVIELRGVTRLDLLASGCSLDLDPAGGWVPGVC